MRIVILGSRGMLGTDLRQALVSIGEVVALDRQEVDVTNSVAVSKIISEQHPDIIVNATGYTDVDGAEDNRAAAFKLNAEAVQSIVMAAAQVQAKLLHFSTEYVFDGTNQAGYAEAAVPHPLSVYGESKAAGEKFVTDYSKGYLVRTSWLYGRSPQLGKPRGMNFIDTMLKLAAEQEKVRVVNDQHGKLTSTKDLAQAVRELIMGERSPGIYHLVNEDVATWYDVACEVWRSKGITTPLVPIQSADYPMKAKRPQYAVLNNTKFPKLRPWQEALAEYLNL